MKVTSQLADVEFKFGPIVREGNRLVLSSAPEQTLTTTVYLSPGDVLQFLGKLLRSPSAILFVLGFPYFYVRARRAGEQTREAEKEHDPHRPW
ncbi:MAG TPA: hypothetical protein VGO53_14520 [Steroidobacteraceae bacterium]|jgi:hypothetical protein|nr:hypothetical protein [Steroidobacteraceae bacterium]